MSKKCTHCQTKKEETLKKIPFVSSHRLVWINILIILLLCGNFAWNIYNTHCIIEIQKSKVINTAQYKAYIEDNRNTDTIDLFQYAKNR